MYDADSLGLLSAILISPGMTFAGVGGFDVPTVTSPVIVGQTGLGWSFTITNTSTNPNDADTVQVLTSDNIFFTQPVVFRAGWNLPGTKARAANTVTISPLTATGGQEPHVPALALPVAATGNPNKSIYSGVQM